jgi:putative membrane protein
MNTDDSTCGGQQSAPAQEAPVSEYQKASEYLASERTFLAWIRTSIAIVSLGFVVAKFGVWLRELSSQFEQQALTNTTGMSLPIGATMIAFGGLVALLAFGHFHIVNKAIEQGRVRPSRRLVGAVAFAVALVAVFVIIYLVVTTRTE